MITGMKREEMRAHRTSMHATVQEYVDTISKKLRVSYTNSDIKLYNIFKSTHVRLPSDIVPDEFVKRILEENGRKRFVYDISFCQKHSGHIEIYLPGKPLITEGFGIMMYFFRELVQYAEAYEKKRKKK